MSGDHSSTSRDGERDRAFLVEIDAALDGFDQTDRRTPVLTYFAQSIPQVWSRLGLTTAETSRQIARALQRFRVLFDHRPPRSEPPQ